MSDELNMSVSSVCVKDDKKYAFVSFTDDTRTAEGKIPDCRIMDNKGFSAEEVEQLEAYMRRELKTLKKMAAGINVIGALMEDGKEEKI